MLSGHGGIGRRVRLRGVWLHRPSSSLGDRTKKTMETDTFSIVFFIHCESNGISSPLGVYHHRRCISSTVGCITFAMMIYSSENEICSFSNGWYSISAKLMIYKAVAVILNNVCGIIFRKKRGDIKAGFFVATAYTNYRFYDKILKGY